MHSHLGSHLGGSGHVEDLQRIDPRLSQTLHHNVGALSVVSGVLELRCYLLQRAAHRIYIYIY